MNKSHENIQLNIQTEAVELLKRFTEIAEHLPLFGEELEFASNNMILAIKGSGDAKQFLVAIEDFVRGSVFYDLYWAMHSARQKLEEFEGLEVLQEAESSVVEECVTTG